MSGVSAPPSGSSDSAALGRRAARGAAWVFGLRAFQRGFSLLRLIVLARLLAPEHLGAMAIALLLMELLNACSQTGFQTALIQRRGPLSAYLDPAWTALVLRGLAIFALLFALAPFAADFFGEPRTVSLIRVVGCSILLQSFSNIGVVLLERDLEFRRLAFHQGAGTLADLIATLAAAWLLGNEWALVVGLLTGDAVRLAASYWVHPYRPKLRLDAGRARELFGFGRWLMLSNVFLFAAHSGDDAVVGRLLGASALGLYQLAYQISHTAVMELSRAASQVALPAYARLRSEPETLRRAYLRVLQGTALLCWPIAGFACVFADDFTRLVLGPRWLPAVPALQILALHAALRATGASIGPVLVAVGRPHAVTWLTFVKCAALAVAILPLVGAFGIAGAALSVLAASVVSNAAANAALIRAIDCRARDLAAVLAAPLLATLGMSALLLALGALSPVAGLPSLALHAGIGAVAYALGAALLGRVGPHPPGAWLGPLVSSVFWRRASAEGER
ncbi:MAG: lipopolysaccharide biosynthesis protein [Myxococcota bacterium]